VGNDSIKLLLSAKEVKEKIVRKKLSAVLLANVKLGCGFPFEVVYAYGKAQKRHYRKLSTARHPLLSLRWTVARSKNRQTVSQGSKSSNDNW